MHIKKEASGAQKKPNVKASNERALTADILNRILEKKEFSHLVLQEALEHSSLDERSKAFITRLTEGTIEYTIQIDFILNHYCSTKTKNMHPVIRTILRMSVYQILYMDKVPVSAAINEAVKLVKTDPERKVRFLSGFVNAVLRAIGKDQETIRTDLRHTGKTPAYIRFSTPLWLYDYLRSIYGKEETERMLAWFLEGKKENYVRFQDGHMETMDGNIVNTEAFRSGEITIQDYASQQVGNFAAPEEGSFIVDVCAAPGGKSCHLASLLHGTGMVDARDLTEDKVRLIKENIERLNLHNIRAKVHDARIPDPSLLDAQGHGTADLVLADLPCSGLGIISKKPDIRFSAFREEFVQLQKLQREILTTVSRYVKPGGRLIYSTCTLSAEENEQNRDWIQETLGCKLIKEQKFLPGLPSDGFYICIFQKD